MKDFLLVIVAIFFCGLLASGINYLSNLDREVEGLKKEKLRLEIQLLKKECR